MSKSKSQWKFGGPLRAELKKWQQPPKWAPYQRTLERLKIIRKNLDKTDAEIGRIFGVTRSAVHALRVRFGIAKRSGSTQRRERFIALVRKMPPGLTPQEMALKLQLPEGRVIYYARFAGYRFPVRDVKAIWNERFKSLPPALTVGAVARQFGVTYGYAFLLCKEFRYKVRDGRSPGRKPRVPGFH